MAVYFIQDEDATLIKIGYSTNFKNRFAQIKRLVPSLKILKVIPGDIELEKEFHNRFSRLKVRGEWFKPGKELLDFIDSLTHSPESCRAKTESLVCLVHKGDKQTIIDAAATAEIFVLSGTGKDTIGSMSRFLRIFAAALRGSERNELLAILSRYANEEEL